MEGQARVTIKCKGCLENLELTDMTIHIKIIWDDKTWTGHCKKCGWTPRSTLEIEQMLWKDESDGTGSDNYPL